MKGEKDKTAYQIFLDLLKKLEVIDAFILTQSEMTEEDYERISFSQWTEIEEKTYSCYYPEIKKLAQKMMLKKFDQNSSSFDGVKEMISKFSDSGYVKEIKELEKVMISKAKTFEDWLYIHLNFKEKISYQNLAFEAISGLKGNPGSYIELAKNNFKARGNKSRWFRLADKEIDNFDKNFDFRYYVDLCVGSDFGDFLERKCLQRDIKFAKYFADWHEIQKKLPLELRNTSYGVKCLEGMYLTVKEDVKLKESMGVLWGVLYPFLLEVNDSHWSCVSKECFEKNNSQNLKISEMIENILNLIRKIFKEKGEKVENPRYWANFYQLAKKNNNSDELIVLKGLNRLKANYSFWKELDQMCGYPSQIRNICLKKMKEAMGVVAS